MKLCPGNSSRSSSSVLWALRQNSFYVCFLSLCNDGDDDTTPHHSQWVTLISLLEENFSQQPKPNRPQTELKAHSSLASCSSRSDAVLIYYRNFRCNPGVNYNSSLTMRRAAIAVLQQSAQERQAKVSLLGSHQWTSRTLHCFGSYLCSVSFASSGMGYTCSFECLRCNRWTVYKLDRVFCCDFIQRRSSTIWIYESSNKRLYPLDDWDWWRRAEYRFQVVFLWYVLQFQFIYF